MPTNDDDDFLMSSRIYPVFGLQCLPLLELLLLLQQTITQKRVKTGELSMVPHHLEMMILF